MVPTGQLPQAKLFLHTGLFNLFTFSPFSVPGKGRHSGKIMAAAKQGKILAAPNVDSLLATCDGRRDALCRWVEVEKWRSRWVQLRCDQSLVWWIVLCGVQRTHLREREREWEHEERRARGGAMAVAGPRNEISNSLAPPS